MSGHEAYLALGANLGARERTLNEALRLLDEHPGVFVLKVSKFHETQPVGGPAGQPLFLNAAAQLHTTLTPRELLELLLATENKLGRERSSPERNLPRTLDLDLLLYDDLILNEVDLVVPHPRMHERAFVLKPLCEIAPGVKHPVLKKSVRELLVALNDPG